MAKFDICWYETYSQTAIIEAANKDDAVEKWNRLREAGAISAVFNGGELIDDEITDIEEVK